MKKQLRYFYNKIRKRMPPRYQSYLTKLVFKFSGKPFVLIDKIPKEKKFPNKEKGGLMLSADFELAWAYRFTKEVENAYQYSIDKARQERKNILLLIPLFEKYSIPITWATVGHLFLNECDTETHHWMKHIPHFENRYWEFSSGDWFDHDPNSNFKESPEWYAPDLIEMILKSSVCHEIGTHTFSHIDFSDKNCPPEVADDEIMASINIMKKWGLKPRSICFPCGSFGNIQILKKHGIEIYRRKIKDYNLAYPYFDEHGLLVTLSTDAFDRCHPSWSAEYYRSRYIKEIDKAISTGTIANFVFHPAMDPWMITEVMDGVLSYAVNKRNRGTLWIGTMGEIADFITKEPKI